MDEQTFKFLIDGRFSFSDEAMSTKIVELACSISPDSAFAVVFELVRGKRSKHAPVDVRLSVLAAVDEQLSHPAKQAVLPIARRAIMGEKVETQEVLGAVKGLSSSPDLWHAVQTLGCCSEDPIVDLEVRRVGAEWSKRS